MAAVTTLDLQRGRTLTIAPAGDDELVEIRASSGTLELRLRITADGPVLEVEAAQLSLRANSVDVDCEDFSVSAGGEITLTGGGDVRVTGDTIHLN